MHSRIYNLDETNYTEDEVYEMVKDVCPLMDYVNEDTDTDGDCEWLGNALPVKGRTITITKEKAIKHWNGIFNQVKRLANEGLSFDNLYTVQRLLNDRTGFLLILDRGVYPLDEFLRYVAQGIIAEGEYTVYKTYDYHF